MNSPMNRRTEETALSTDTGYMSPLESYLAPTLLSDADHPRVKNLAEELTVGAATDAEKAERLVHYVAERIAPQLPGTGDETSASRTLELGYGHETAKATLLVALARAANIPARLHFARFDKSLMREFLPGWAWGVWPDTVATGWAELYVDGRWQPRPDAAYDADMLHAAKRYLAERGLNYGVGLTLEPGAGANGWTSQLAKRFPLVSDDGVYRDTMDYVWSEAYPNTRRHSVIRWFLGPWGRSECARRQRAIREAGRDYEAIAA